MGVSKSWSWIETGSQRSLSLIGSRLIPISATTNLPSLLFSDDFLLALDLLKHVSRSSAGSSAHYWPRGQRLQTKVCLVHLDCIWVVSAQTFLTSRPAHVFHLWCSKQMRHLFLGMSRHVCSYICGITTACEWVSHQKVTSLGQGVLHYAGLGGFPTFYFLRR